MTTETNDLAGSPPVIRDQERSMTENHQPGYGQYEPPPATEPETAPPPSPKRRRWVWPTVASAAALFVGVAIGSSGDEPATAEPTTETVTVSQVPASCLDALDSAEDLMSISADFAGVASDLPLMVGEAAEAGVNYDVAALEDITARLNEVTAEVEELTGQVNSSPYGGEAADCRDAAEEQK